MGAFRNGAYAAGGNAGVVEAMGQAGIAVHPVVMHHPVSGRPYLNVSESFTPMDHWHVGARGCSTSDHALRHHQSTRAPCPVAVDAEHHCHLG